MKIMVSIAGRWGRYPLFLAKVGTMPGSLVMIKRARSFEAGQIIQFSEERENSGRCKSCTLVGTVAASARSGTTGCSSIGGSMPSLLSSTVVNAA